MTNENSDDGGPKIKTHILHFIGAKLYSPVEFATEAKQHGVNRAFPSWLLKNANLQFGDTILLGDWKREPSFNVNAQTKLGTARIWGKFQVTSANFDASPTLRKRLNELMNLESPNEEIREHPKMVVRKCGSYVLSASRETQVPLPKIVEAWETAQIDTGEKGKMFLAGQFIEVSPEVPISKPVGFSRAGVFVDYLETRLGNFARPSVGFLEGYSQVKYIPKAKGVTAPSPSPTAPSHPQGGDGDSQ